MKKKALYLLFNYPILADAYIEAEIRAVSQEYDVLVIVTETSKGVPEYQTNTKHISATTYEQILQVAQEFKPDVLHAHRLFMLPTLEKLSEDLNIPYTVRSHANDAIPSADPRMIDWMEKAPKMLPEVTTNPLCLGILCFPFTRKNLLRWGSSNEKLHDCRPVIDYHRFHDTTPNGESVITMGSYLLKKRMDKFIELAKLVPTRRFKLYGLSSRMNNIDELKKLTDSINSPAEVMDPVNPGNLPSIFKDAQWYVYFGDKKMANFGWPVSIGEAQAAGVGVCMANLRDDLKYYIGEAGYLFNSTEELVDIISKPFPEQKRQLGYEQAKKSDINSHINILLDLWAKA